MLAFVLALAGAQAASLDNLEVGGAWGSPLTTEPTAAWWNPAGLAEEDGARFRLEVAPVLAAIDFDRDDPFHGGRDAYRLVAPVPFLGFATDAGVEGLGLGLALAFPYARGSASIVEDGPGRFAMREGGSRAAFVLGGVGYRPAGTPLSLGASVALVRNTWQARVDTETTTSLHQSIAEMGGQSGYTDAQIEDPRYATTLEFAPLGATTATFGAGGRVDLGPVTAGVTYIHGARLVNRGLVDLQFSCPPQDDEQGRFGAESMGLCHTRMTARAEVAYRLPSRVHGGVVAEPLPGLRTELMGGFVFWSVLESFRTTISDVAELNDLKDPEAAELVERQRSWARDNQDSMWLGLDVKGEVGERWLLGGRVIHDRAAVPDHTLSPNNWDADTVMLGGLVAFEVMPEVQISLQWTHHLIATRTVTDSAFLVTLDPDRVRPDRYSYPQMAGRYEGRINRIGVSIGGRLGER